jgi:hypothetical protein
VAFISSRGPEKQMHVSALIAAVVTGCRAPGFKTTNQGISLLTFYRIWFRFDLTPSGIGLIPSNL